MKISYIELLGEKHPLCYSLSAYEEINDTFGSSEAMTEQLKYNDFSAVDKILGIFLRAGRRYCEAAGEKLPKEITCRIADVIDMRDPDAIGAIFGAIANGGKREVDTLEAASKNADPTPAET